MTFNDWVNAVGGIDKAAKILKTKQTTVRSWVRFDRAPKAKNAREIVKRSSGLVDYNGIYQPFEDVGV